MKKDKNIGDNLHYSWEIEAQSKYFEDYLIVLYSISYDKHVLDV